MKQETIDKVVQQLNRSLVVYQRRLIYWLEFETEVELKNGNLKVAKPRYGKIKKYELILADLATIRRAVKNGKTEVKVNGTAEGGSGYIYPEVEVALARAGLYWDGDGYGTLYLMSMNEMEE